MSFFKCIFGLSMLASVISAYAGDALIEKIAGEPESVFSVGTNGGVPTAFYNGNPVKMMIYSSINSSARSVRHVRGISGTGIHYYEVPMCFYEFLPEKGEPDFSSAPSGLRGFLDQDPNAYFMVRIYMVTPGWWQKKHPDELVKCALDGTVGIESAASKAWIEQTNTMIKKYVDTMEKSPYGKRILGYHLDWGQPYGEWHYPQFGSMPDTGVAMTLQFRRWLSEKYGIHPEFANAQVPNLEERNRSNGGIFRDPANTVEQRVSDYYRCQHGAVRDAMLSFCKTAKETVNSKKMIGVFYGYYFHMGYNQTQMAEGGHLAIGDIISSPYVDFLSGPYSYQHDSRKVGGDGCLRSIMESIKLHGKMFFTEADEPTYLGCSQGVDIKARGTDTPAGTISAMRRNFCNVMIHGSDLWWFDIGPKDAEGGLGGGWWDPPQLLAEMKKFVSIGVDSLKHDRSSAAQIAVICNPETYYYLVCYNSNKDKLTHPLLHETVRAMYHAGAPFDLVLASDIDRLDYKRYKLFVFLDDFYLDQATRKMIDEKIKTNGHTVLWVYAPGYVTENSLSVKAMSDLIGMQTDLSTTPRNALVSPSAGTPFNQNDAVKTFGLPVPVSPVFAVNDKKAKFLGNIAGTPLCGFAMKKFPTWTSIYTYAPPVSTALLRALYRSAGVHIYNDANDVLYANRSYVAITGETGGQRTIRLPGKADVTDLFTGKKMAKDRDSFSFQFEPKSTQLFLISYKKQDNK